MAIVSRSLDSLRQYVGSFTWAPFVQLSRSTVLGLLQRIELGQLVVTDYDGSVTICGHTNGRDEVPRTQLKVLKETFWVRVLLFADMVRCQMILQKRSLLAIDASQSVGFLRELYAGRVRMSGLGIFLPRKRRSLWVVDRHAH